jgi:hypothetical protein
MPSCLHHEHDGRGATHPQPGQVKAVGLEHRIEGAAATGSAGIRADLPRPVWHNTEGQA